LAKANARLLLVPDAGHEFWAEQPEVFLKAAEQFLRGRYPEGARAVHEPAK
jgi:pimeloyl-ACP methyl ester carboxylesterase